MSFEGWFLLGYADVLLVVALALHRLGRVNPSPWASRVLAGNRRRHGVHGLHGDDGDALPGGPGREPPGWPHAEQPRLHTGIALVAAVAAGVLAAAALWRHHDGPGTVPLAVTCGAAVVVGYRLARSLSRGPSRAD